MRPEACALLKAFASDRSGATAIEYALLASLIFLAIIFGVGLVAAPLNSIFDQVAAGFPG